MGRPSFARYSRQMLLEEIGVAGQQRLARSSVLVLGAGGLGSPAALYLAAAGVGRLGIAEFDRVEEHNLHRQILHGTDSVGGDKVDSAVARLRDLNPTIEFTAHREGLKAAAAVALFRRYDVVVDGTDNFPTRYLSNDAAFFAGVPLVSGSILRWEGQITVLHPRAGGPCYRCLFPHPPAAGSVPNCGEAGVVGPVCGIIGSFQALEAIKLITGAGRPLIGRLLVVDTLGTAVRSLNVRKDPDCPLCGQEPAITSVDPSAYSETCLPSAAAAAEPEGDELPPADADRWIRSSDSVLVLDVREPVERSICAIPGSRHIPMREVPERLAELPRATPILVYCHHGMRSRRVMEFLRSKGFDGAVNLAGGIDAWSREVDTSVPRY
ncbi:MAG: molybdopterin-synthase adenylyltransferase MoeB [Puniceicoccaceae bacterium]|nr:MAG: molybdopterin-synthase adenylyltransferase MoeB [Puniceicoccaceae bacterium]